MAAFPIPTSAKRTARFTPPSLRPVKDEESGADKGGAKECAFVLRIPTPSERDQIGTRLYELGVTTVSQESIRATLIDDLFNQDWAALLAPADIAAQGLEDPEKRATYNELEAEKRAEFLDGYWSKAQIDEMAITEWKEKEVQRRLDVAAGAKDEGPLAEPMKTVTPREHARSKLMVDDMMERSYRLRKLAAQQLDYSRRNGLMMVRVHVLDQLPKDPEAWPVTLERDAEGLLTEETVDELREHIGDIAYHELVNAVNGHYDLAEEERKNSDSPLGTPSDPNGSETLSGGSESNDGSSTESSTGAIQSEGSATTTGKSSGSTSAPKAKTARKSGRTAKD